MKLKRVLLSILAIIAILSNMSFVYAAGSFSVGLTTDKKTYTAGETVIVTLKLTQVNMEDGIWGLSGVLEYNTNVFEEIVSNSSGYTDSIKTKNNWEGLTYNSRERSFGTNILVPAKEPQDVITIELKVKEDAYLGDTTIRVTSVEAANSIELNGYTANPASVTVKIDKEVPPTQNIIQTATPTPTQKPTTIPTITTATKTPTTINPTVAPTPSSTKLPQTGIDDTVVPLLFVALIVSMAAYIAYRRYKDI